MRAKKAKPKAKRSSTGSRGRSLNGKSSGTKPKPKPKAARGVGGSSSNGAGAAATQIASKARIPLLAGSALVGAVGGVMLGATRSGGKVLGLTLPHPPRVRIRSGDLAAAAKEVGRFGEQVGELTTELKQAREGLGKGQNSPLEIILKGLTARR